MVCVIHKTFFREIDLQGSKIYIVIVVKFKIPELEGGEVVSSAKRDNV